MWIIEGIFSSEKIDVFSVGNSTVAVWLFGDCIFLRMSRIFFLEVNEFKDGRYPLAKRGTTSEESLEESAYCVLVTRSKGIRSNYLVRWTKMEI